MIVEVGEWILKRSHETGEGMAEQWISGSAGLQNMSLVQFRQKDSAG
jgi:hypothetical protein